MASHNPFTQLFTYYTFQLAALEPSASPDEPIKVSLREQCRTDELYECVSYDRSQDYGSTKIILDDREIEIPQPLEAALRALRKKDKARLLWADVILGRTLQELNAQAAVSKAVLQSAHGTVVWLGPGQQKTKQAFQKIMTLAIWWRQAALRTNFPDNMSLANRTQVVAIKTIMGSHDSAELERSDKPLWDAVIKVFCSGYFESVQSIPDMILSKEITIMSGEGSIDWSDFVAAYRGLITAMPELLGMQHPPELIDGFTRVMSIETAKQRFLNDPGLRLLPMIHTARDMKCTDIREYVFAMLQVVSPAPRTEDNPWPKGPLPAVDYNKTDREVFIEAARYIILERQDFLIWWTERPPNARRMANLPSWVPDWTLPLPDNVVKLTPENEFRKWSKSVMSKGISIEDNTLRVQAHVLGRIKSISPKFTESNCRRLLLTQWQAFPTTQGETIEDKIHRFWRTIVLNVGGRSETLRGQAAPPKELWISFQSVIAEERILELLNCKPEDLVNNPELAARARSNPQIASLGPTTGKSEAFEGLLRKNTIGRRFFTTNDGKTGMTAFEDLPEGGNDLDAKLNANASRFNDIADNDGFAGSDHMLSSFQEYVSARDPNAAMALADMATRRKKVRGAKVGDFVVALVGGFQPYLLRSVGGQQTDQDQLLSGPDAKYRFVGDCYLHGAMQAECFKVPGVFWGTAWNQDVTFVDVKIV
jgi:hypothetical protein